MKAWEKILREHLTQPYIIASAREQNATWRAFGQSISMAEMNRALDIGKHVQHTTHTCAITGTRAHVTRTTGARIDVQPAHLDLARRYAIVKHLEFTHELVMTTRQRSTLDTLSNSGDPWRAVWCMRRRDTAATAIVLRAGTTWAVVYEDGTMTRNQIHSDGMLGGRKQSAVGIDPNIFGSWYYNARIKRGVQPRATALKTIKKAGGFSIRRYQ